jgi:uncharacterized spore protein YtfJ
MMESAQSFLAAAQQGREHLATMIDRIYGAARPGAVFGEPVTSGGYTVITAQEISSGGGFGTGGGFGSDGSGASSTGEGEEAPPAPAKSSAGGGGSGIGGGGGAMSRPVAAIIIGPDGVRIEPIVDRTKVAITLISSVLAMAAVAGKMRRRG